MHDIVLIEAKNNNNTTMKPRKSASVNPSANQDDDNYLPVPPVSTESVVFPAPPSIDSSTDSEAMAFDSSEEKGLGTNRMLRKPEDEEEVVFTKARNDEASAADESSTRSGEETNANANRNHGSGIPWAAIVIFIGLGSALIATINTYATTHLLLFLYVWAGFTLLTSVFILIRAFKDFKKCCCFCCGNVNGSLPDGGRAANRWGCCKDVGSSILFTFFCSIPHLATVTFYILLIYIGVAMLIMVILLLSWRMKRSRFIESSSHSTNNSTNFWRGYWVSVCIFISSFLCAVGFQMLTMYILEPTIRPMTAYIWSCSSSCVVFVFISRISNWRKTNYSTNISHISTVGNGIYAVDLFIYNIGIPLGTLIIVWITSVKLFIPLLALVAGTMLILAAVSWRRTNLSRTNGTATANNNPSSTTRNKKYPKDSYSFLALYSPMLDTNLFCFGLMVFLFQSILLILLILSVTVRIWRTIGEVGNPESLGVSVYMPANADPLVRATQITSIFSFIIFMDANLSDFSTAIELMPRPGQVTTDNLSRGIAFSCLLRLIEGILSIVAVYLLVMTSGEVIEIILNFTAVNFISLLDNVAFQMARSGKYGPAMEEAAARIEKENLPECSSRASKSNRYTYGLIGVFLFLSIMILNVVVQQESHNSWVTKTVRVQFEESTSLTSYSGCYKIDQNNRPDKRFIYNGFEENLSSGAKLGYCKDKRRWLFFKGVEIDPCEAFGGEQELARSPKTDSFDIYTLIEEGWLSPQNLPLDMYFIAADNLDDTCGDFLNDGNCDPDFNNFDYQYDGGDCCAATCNQPDNCGKNALRTVFGIESPGDGYPRCKAQGMVSIIIRLDEIILKTDQAQSSLLKLDCTGHDGNFYNVFAINATKEIENRTEAAVVEDSSKCSLYVENVHSGGTDFLPAVKYSVFHGYKNEDNDIVKDQFILFQRENFDSTTKDEAFNVHGIFSQDSLTSNIGRNINWTSLQLAGYDLTGTIPREIGDLTKLTSLNLTSNQHTGSIPIEIELLTELGQLDLSNNDFFGSIRSEIGLLNKLTELDLSNNDFFGSIPSEIGLLNKLTELDLSNNDFFGSIPSEIGLLNKLTELDLSRNGFFGDIPSEIGLLTELTELDLEKVRIRARRFGNRPAGTVPSEIGLLTKLKKLRFYYSAEYGDQHLNGDLPSEIALLTELTSKNFNLNY